MSQSKLCWDIEIMICCHCSYRLLKRNDSCTCVSICLSPISLYLSVYPVTLNVNVYTNRFHFGYTNLNFFDWKLKSFFNFFPLSSLQPIINSYVNNSILAESEVLALHVPRYNQPANSFFPFWATNKKTCFCDLVSRHENGIWLFWLSRLGIWYQLNLFLLKCIFLLCSREKSSWQDEWYHFCILCFEINIPFKKPNQLRSMFCIC